MSATPARVCIVTGRVDGLHAACPTALAAGLLARALAEHAGEVTLIVADAPAGDAVGTEWCSYFDAVDVRLECLYLPTFMDHYKSWYIFRHLRARDFTHILFMDRSAPGYWSIRAQRQGLAFRDTALILVVADPTALDPRTRAAAPTDPPHLVTLELENFLLGQAPTILATSPGLAAYVARHRKGREPVTLPPFLPSVLLDIIAHGRGARARYELDLGAEGAPTIVSLGLLGLASEPSGVRLVVDLALSQSAGEIPHIGEVVAIGGTGPLATAEDGYLLLALALRSWQGNLELRPCRTLEEFAADVAAQPMVVLDSRGAGSGETAQWFALAAGHPVVSASVGETAPGIVAAEVATAGRALRDGGARGGAFRALAQTGARRIAEIVLEARPPSERGGTLRPLPKVSVCMNHFDRPTLLDQALESLRNQTYADLEVVLYDDGSPSEQTRHYLDNLKDEFERRGWKLIRGEGERWPAAGRNEAARHATGDYILIMDDDNIARDEEVEMLVSVALRTNADAVGCFAYLFEGNETPDHRERSSSFGGWIAGVPLGHGTQLASIWNIFGDVNYLYKSSVFREIGGFEDLPTIGCEDYQISLRLAQVGYAVEMVPVGLYDYRYSAHNMARGISNERSYYSHLRISQLAGRLSACPRILFDLGAMYWNGQCQKQGGSYWSQPGRAPYQDPYPNAPLWRQDKSRARLRAALAIHSVDVGDHP